MGSLKVTPIGLPSGITVAGGDIAAELPDPAVRSLSRRTVLSLTASADAKFADSEMGFRATGGDGLSATAKGMVSIALVVWAVRSTTTSPDAGT